MGEWAWFETCAALHSAQWWDFPPPSVGRSLQEARPVSREIAHFLGYTVSRCLETYRLLLDQFGLVFLSLSP